MLRMTACAGQLFVLILLVLAIESSPAIAQEETATAPEETTDAKSRHSLAVTPDIRDSETKLKVQKGNFVVVPIPIANPTVGTGLVGGGAYFYPQTEEQKKTQPASVTAAAGFYTDSDSFGYGIVQQNYWSENRWRFTGALAYADLKLSLLTDDGSGGTENLAWLIDGSIAYVNFSRKLGGKWYAGAIGRYVDASQSIESIVPSTILDDDSDIRSVGLGARFEYDNRDMPINTYTGNRLTGEFLFNDESLGSDNSYQSYTLTYSSYHQLSEPWVLAWTVAACKKDGTVPIWDACRLDLRGFSMTDYLGKKSGSAQLEARWRMSERWGLVGFAGAGYMNRTIEGSRESEPIPSYGIGIRFMVLKAKRINLRIDYARSLDSDAIHVAVGEAF